MSGSSENSQYRLPVNVKPTHYDLTIRTDLVESAFDGHVRIDLDVEEETSTIVFNSHKLDLKEVSIYSDALKKDLAESSRNMDDELERASFTFTSALPAGSKAQLTIVFRAQLGTSMAGYYKSSWKNAGETQWYALTQFGPTFARSAFPCWDEPALKATFVITLVSPVGTVNLSNMNVISEEVYQPQNTHLDKVARTWLPDDDKASGQWKITKFGPTPPMSTYLAAWANGRFQHVGSSYKSPLTGKERPLRVYSMSDNIHQTQFALEVMAKVLPLYEQVFEIEYPLPKLDTLVAHDLDPSAMENWGLITGRTSAFLLDPEKADLPTRKRVAVFESHEIAHMWFGDITTMAWWDYLYLNEGFATLVGEVIMIDRIFPEWKVDSVFINIHMSAALSLDAKPSSHPIEVSCPDARRINQIFDALSYSKAASVLRMLSNLVGEDRFLKGVSLYLKKHLYGNSVTTDLWDGIGEASGMDVPKIMDNWIAKIGFPVITVTEGPNGIHLRQDRFLESEPAEPKDNETLWAAPLNLLTVDDTGKAVVDKTVLLDKREMDLAVDVNKPYKLNADTKGVYRVLYTPDRLAIIATEAAKEKSIFSLSDRIGLVHDAFALAMAGLTKTSSALDLVHILRNEKESLVWSGIRKNLAEIAGTWWEDTNILDHFNEFRRRLFEPLIEKLGYEFSSSESADIIELRTAAISQAEAAGSESVIAELRRRFTHYMVSDDDSQIPADLQSVTFDAGVKYGGREEYNFMKKIIEKPKTPSVQYAVIHALGSSRDPELIEDTLRFALEGGRDQDVLYYFEALSANLKARRRAANYFMENFDALYKRFEGNFLLSAILKRSLADLSTKEDAVRIELFFRDKDTSKYNQALSQLLDGIRTKAMWIERSSADVRQWLNNWGNSKL